MAVNVMSRIMYSKNRLIHQSETRNIKNKILPLGIVLYLQDVMVNEIEIDGRNYIQDCLLLRDHDGRTF